MYKILSVTKKDFPQIIALLKKCDLDFKRRVSDLKQARKMSNVFLVCKEENKVIGMIRAIFDGHYCILFDLAVDPKFRKQNIGKLLMEKAEKKLKKQGAGYIFLNSSDKAVCFYKKLGYKKPKTNPLIKYLKKHQINKIQGQKEAIQSSSFKKRKQME